MRWLLCGVLALVGCDDEASDPVDDGDSAADSTGASETSDESSGGGRTSGGSSASSDGSGATGGPSSTTTATTTDESAGSDTSPDASTGDVDLDLEQCVAQAEAVQFDNTPPQGQTRVAGLGDCIELLDGPTLWNYHCQWCHSTLDNNDIDDRTLDRIWWAVDFSEELGNWPLGDLSGRPDAVERIFDAVVASPPPVADHPHPLPEYE